MKDTWKTVREQITAAMKTYPNGRLDDDLLNMCAHKYGAGESEHGVGTWKVGNWKPWPNMRGEIIDLINYTAMGATKGEFSMGKGHVLFWHWLDGWNLVGQVEKKPR